MSRSSDAPVELLADQLSHRVVGFIRRVGGPAALADSTRWRSDPDVETRTLGWAVLGQLAVDEPPAAAVLLAAGKAGSQDPEPVVRRAVARALGNQSNSAAAAEVLLAMIGDPDRKCRVHAIGGLGTTLDAPSADHPAVLALIALLADDDAKIRDWAAFVLGSQLEVDTPELRDALLAIANDDIDEDWAYPAAEAAAGLVARGDRRVVDTVIRRLGAGSVGRLWLELATNLADPRLAPALTALRAEWPDDGDDWDSQLEKALVACAVWEIPRSETSRQGPA
jgi:HEAT repeat protein